MGEEAKVSDADETSGQYMLDKAAEELRRRQSHFPVLFAVRVGIRGLLKIEGHRLDSPAPTLRSHVPAGYGDLGFQATYLIFPTPGCWEVTAHIGTASVTFVTKVIKIGDGPNWHQDP